MEPSRLELYLDALKILEQGSSKNSADLLNEFKLDCDTMKERLSFLVKRRLVEKRCSREQVFYKISKKGKNILRYFNELDNRSFAVDLRIGIDTCKNNRDIWKSNMNREGGNKF
jgi:predicted transcriptional regulator